LVEQLALIVLLGLRNSLAILRVLSIRFLIDTLGLLEEDQAALLHLFSLTDELRHRTGNAFVVVLHAPLLIQSVAIFEKLTIGKAELDPGVFLHDGIDLDIRVALEHLLVISQQVGSLPIYFALKAHSAVLSLLIRCIRRLFRLTAGRTLGLALL